MMQPSDATDIAPPFEHWKIIQPGEIIFADWTPITNNNNNNLPFIRKTMRRTIIIKREKGTGKLYGKP